jgi:hypothetical protein
MALVLSNEDAEKVLTMGGAIEALEQLYRDLGQGSAVNRGRTDLFTPTVAKTDADIPSAHQFKTLDGAIPRLQVASIRVTSTSLRSRSSMERAGESRFLLPPATDMLASSFCSARQPAS